MVIKAYDLIMNEVEEFLNHDGRAYDDANIGVGNIIDIIDEVLWSDKVVSMTRDSGNNSLDLTKSVYGGRMID